MISGTRPHNTSSLMSRGREIEGRPVGRICGGPVAALLVLHAPMFAPVIKLAGLAAALANEEAVHAVSPA